MDWLFYILDWWGFYAFVVLIIALFFIEKKERKANENDKNKELAQESQPQEISNIGIKMDETLSVA